MERTSVGSLLRTTQAFCQQICEKHTLDFGIAFLSRRFQNIPEVNQVREVMLGEAATIPAAFDQINALFESKGSRCLRWAPAMDVDSRALAAFLADRGFIERKSVVYRLDHWPVLDFPAKIRVLPARAMRNTLVDTFAGQSIPKTLEDRRLLAESFLERLDDPQLDLFVALAGKEPAGRCGLYQVGDIARVLGMSVLPAYENQGVDRALLAHALALARRLTMPVVLAQVASSDSSQNRLMLDGGFVPDGHVVDFESPTAYLDVPPA